MSSSLGIGLVGAMLIVPQLTLIHPYLHLLIVAPLLVWVGCEGALMEHQKAPEDSQVQQVDSQSTTNFPGRTLSTRLPMRAAHRRPLRRRWKRSPRKMPCASQSSARACSLACTGSSSS